MQIEMGVNKGAASTAYASSYFAAAPRRTRLTNEHGSTRLRVVLSLGLLAGTLFASASPVRAQYWVSFETHTRYLALGDSIAMGYGAKPATQGYVYLLYQGGTIDDINHMLFGNAAVSRAKSSDVLAYQLPQVGLFLIDTGLPYRKVITLNCGGADLLQVLDGADPATVLTTYASNLGAILATLSLSFPDVQIYVATMYDPELDVPTGSELIAALNGITAAVVSAFPSATLVDVHAAFQGRSGLLLGEKHGAGPLEVHPTNAGHQVIAAAFADAIRGD